MSSKKMNILIGIATFVIVYGEGILIFQALSYIGLFFVEKDPTLATLYTFLAGVALVLFVSIWIKTERKMLIIINTSFAVCLLIFTPAIANGLYTAPEEIRTLFHSNHKKEIQAIEKTIQDQHLPFSLYKKESLQSSKEHNFLAILLIKTSHSKLTPEEIYSFIDYIPKSKMLIYFDDMVQGQVAIIELDDNKNITNCKPKESCNSLQINISDL